MTPVPTIQAVVFDLVGVVIRGWGVNRACLELIEELHARNVRLALLSNGWSTSKHLRTTYSFLHDFEAIFLSREMGVSKPSPLAFRIVEQTLALPPQAIFFTDDAHRNIKAARQRGWQTHHYQDVSALRLELEAWDLL